MATYNEGYYEQPAYTTTADLESVGLHRFGYPIDDKPMIEIGISEEVIARDIYGQGYQSIEAGPQRADLVSARFHPVNGKFLYWTLGNQTTTTGVRTISNLDYSARKPFLSAWKQVNDLKLHCYGVLFDSCNFSMQQGSSPIVTLVGKGLDIASDSFTPSITYDNSIDSRFDYISSMTWDGDSLTPYAITINWKQNAKPIIGYDGSYQDINGQKPVFGTIVAVCTAAQGEVVFADWEASAAKTFTVSIGKSTEAHTIVGTFANARLYAVAKTERFGIEPIYTISMMIQSTSCVVTDGI